MLAGILLLPITLGIDLGIANNAHPEPPPVKANVARPHMASSGMLPPVIESQREPNDHGEPAKASPAMRPQSGGPVPTPSQPRQASKSTVKPTNQANKNKEGGQVMLSTSTQVLTLHSSAFAANQPIPTQFSCEGANLSPPLSISHVPAQAKSLALIVDDPDAPRGTFTHWLLWNIPPETNAIAEGQPPAKAEEGLNDFGKLGYGGPCPPSGTHRYRFRLFALDTDLNLPNGAGIVELERALRPHVLAESLLVGTYKRH
jgi:Raf kinase inhibitor-like YbhB/YbcL family protein